MTSRFKISSKITICSLFDPYFSPVIVFFTLQLRNIDNEEVKISAALAKNSIFIIKSTTLIKSWAKEGA